MEQFSVAVILFAEKKPAGFRLKLAEICDNFETDLTFPIAHCDIDFNAHFLQTGLFDPLLVGYLN